MKKITRATVKAFIRRHRDHLFVKEFSYWDGQEDMCVSVDDPPFVPADFDRCESGIDGGSRRVTLTAYKELGFEGYEVLSHRSFVVAVRSGVLLAEQLGAKLPRASAAPSRSRL